jgi:hypothetical protein
MNSRYIRLKQKSLPSRKRVRKVHGAFEDKDKYFKCWNCGSINSIERNIGFDGNGIFITDPTISSSVDTRLYPNKTVDCYQIINIGTSGLMELVILENGPDEEAIEIYYTPRQTESVKGCWFCGATNIY